MKKLFLFASLLAFYALTSAQISMNSSGNVGIGTSPQSGYKLSVSSGTSLVGNTRFNNGYAYLDVTGVNQATAFLPRFNYSCYLGSSSRAFREVHALHLYEYYSDSTHKENIRELDNALDIVMNLKGIRFDFKKSVYNKSLSPNGAFDNESERKNNIGFIAQEMIKVLPEAVKYTDSTGLFGISYTRIIPVLVEAMKEQQTVIDKMNSEIESLKSDLLLLTTQIPAGRGETLEAGKPYLSQNVPNPFNENTNINFYLPEDSQSAILYIHDAQGKQIKAYSIENRGTVNVSIKGGELQSGMYFYSLSIDGKEIDAKRMLLTN